MEHKEGKTHGHLEGLSVSTHLLCYEAKLSKLKLESQVNQLLGSVSRYKFTLRKHLRLCGQVSFEGLVDGHSVDVGVVDEPNDLK
jgi:hypothetical protein